MTTFDSQTLKRFHCLSLSAGGRADRSLLARPRKKLPGGGTEATGLRDYAPGDDYRYIDWTWTARRDELLTKVFEGEEDRSIYVLLDCSPSMGLGRPAKFDLARRIAALLGYAAVTNLMQIGVAAFSGGVVARHPPLRDRARFGRLLRFLEGLSLQGTQTDLARAAESFSRSYQRHGPVVVISDLYAPGGFRRGLDVLLHRGYEPRVVQIYDPAEAKAELLGDLELHDVEAGRSRRVTVTEKAARRYRELFAEFQESIRGYCAKYGMACMQAACDTPEDEVLLRVLGREKASVGIT